MTSSDVWGSAAAESYEETSAAMYAADVLDPTVDFLANLAPPGPVLEFAIGTGRVAIPLSRRGVAVQGIELSEAMVAQLRTKADEAAIPVSIGDMATTVVPGEFSLVYLVWNALGNLLTQQEQVACFRNAARHLRPGGRFLIELWVPPLRRLPPGQTAAPFDVTDDHLGFDTYDLVTQRGCCHHYWPKEDGHTRHAIGNFRYVWPSECDLMAQLAGLELENRFADWDRSEFTAESTSHVSVWRKP